MRALVALLTFLFLLLATSASCSTHGKLEARPWADVAPLVRVCPDSPVTKGEVQWALDSWAAHGAPQLEAVYSYCADIESATDTVFITGPQLWAIEHWTPGTVGLTVAFSETRDGPTKVASIGLINSDLRVLLHEVGHLWISDHWPEKGHVMTEYIENFDASNWEGMAPLLRKAR